MSQIDYAIDRVTWLYENRDLIGGLRFEHEPKILRFFLGKLAPYPTGRKTRGKILPRSVQFTLIKTNILGRKAYLKNEKAPSFSVNRRAKVQKNDLN